MKGRRFPLAITFLLVLAWAYSRSAAQVPEPDGFQDALNFARSLPDAGERIRNAGSRLFYAVAFWRAGGDSAALADSAQRECSWALGDLRQALDLNPEVHRVWAPAQARFTASAPYGNATVLFRIVPRDAAPGPVPRFVRISLDLAAAREHALDLAPAAVTYAAVFLSNVPTGVTQVSVPIRSGAASLGAVAIEVSAPPTGTLTVAIANGPAAAALYAPNGELAIPADALSFDEGGFSYAPGRTRTYQQAHFWPGDSSHRRAFFVPGRFTVRAPEGTYKLFVSKGPEFIPVSENIAVQAGVTASHRVSLRRWIDMPAQGWYSGDGHVHYARANADADQRLMLWTQAEDVHVANILRMGDARLTYFEQYAFGKPGRAVSGDYAIVPGQEDPRTNVIGHAMQLNLQRPVRFPDRYYLYDLVFDAVHAMGGLTGYAHVYQPAAGAFFVRRDMSLNVPFHRVDFAEICEFGDVGEELYYEFLNLGFPLTASAGSDVPWGNTIGDSRVYVHTGSRFDTDAWYLNLKAGHTFVTNGPMLDFTVNGQLPGSEITAKSGDVLHIKASARSNVVPPRYLEIVEQGRVVHGGESLSAEFDVPVKSSTWIAARCAGAHTTPVYVKVNGAPFWRLDQVDELVARRLQDLRDLEELTAHEILPLHTGNFDNPDVFKRNAADLRERIAAARQAYRDVQEQARRSR